MGHIYVARKEIRLCICLVMVPLLLMFYLLSEHSSHLQEFKFLLFSPEILLHNIPLNVQAQLNTSESTLMKFIGVIMLGSGEVSYSEGQKRISVSTGWKESLQRR